MRLTVAGLTDYSLWINIHTLLVVIMPIDLSYHSAQGLIQLSMAVGYTVGPSVGGWLQEVRWCCHLATLYLTLEPSAARQKQDKIMIYLWTGNGGLFHFFHLGCSKQTETKNETQEPGTRGSKVLRTMLHYSS